MTPPATERRIAGRDEGVSEVVGSILMVALTVATAAAMVAVVYGAVPDDGGPKRASFSADLRANGDGWGSGDETVRVSHKGGQALPEPGTTIVVEVAGEETRFDEGGPNPLDHGGQSSFASDDRTLSIGERWDSQALSIPEGARVTVTIVDTRASKSVWTATLTASGDDGTGGGAGACDNDTDPPSVASWTQDPSDVDTATTGPVSVDASLADDCAGVDASQDPELHFRVDDGTDPAFTNAGAMTHQGGTTWSGSIPDQTWSDHGGDTLEYKLVGMRDQQGNTGESALRQDVIEQDPTTTITPVTTFTVNEGTASSNPEAAAASDDGDEVTFTEETTSTPTSFTLDADDFRDPSSTWNDEANGFVSDDQYATTTATNPVHYRLSPPSTITTVSSVVLRAELSITNHDNDAFQLAACFPSGDCGAASGQLGASATDVDVQYDVTSGSRHPLGNASWSQSDLETLEVRITPVENSGGGPPRDGTWRVDRAWTTVSGSTETHSLDVVGDFASVPAGSHTLEMEYRVSGDTFDVQVWDWNAGAWTTRGTVLDQTSSTTWTYALAGDEYDDANERVRMRYVDRADGGSQGQLFVDYLQVVTS